MRKLILLLTIAVGMGTVSAKADLLIEPFLGYETGNFVDNDGTTDLDVKGVGYGLRLGMKMLGFGVGAEYAGGAMKYDDIGVITYKPKNIGAFVSYDFPIMVRAYLTYFFSADTDIEIDGVSTVGTYKGSGYRLGVGLTTLPFVTINAEYLVRNYDEAESGGSTGKVDYTMKTYMLSLSFPLSL